MGSAFMLIEAYFFCQLPYVTGRGGQRQEREGLKDFPKQFI